MYHPSAAGFDSNRPARTVYRPYHVTDAHQTQAMIQGTSFSSLSFNTHAGNILFLATEGDSIKAIVTARIDYTDRNTLVLGECYMRGAWGNDEHLAELHIALKLWAQRTYGVQWFKMNDYEDAHPIGIQGIMDRAASQGFVDPTLTETVQDAVVTEYAPVAVPA